MSLSGEQTDRTPGRCGHPNETSLEIAANNSGTHARTFKRILQERPVSSASLSKGRTAQDADVNTERQPSVLVLAEIQQLHKNYVLLFSHCCNFTQSQIQRRRNCFRHNGLRAACLIVVASAVASFSAACLHTCGRVLIPTCFSLSPEFSSGAVCGLVCGFSQGPSSSVTLVCHSHVHTQCAKTFNFQVCVQNTTCCSQVT